MNDKTSNIFIDVGPRYLQLPPGKDVVPRDSVDYVTKLNEIDSPVQRLYIFLNSYFDVSQSETTLEASAVRNLTFVGIAGGLTYGALSNTQNIRDRFIRKHNAAAFNSQHIAQRRYYDYFVSRIISRAFKYGVQGGFLCGSAGLVGYGSIVYRDRVYAPDWVLGFASLGALSRFMLGPKAWLFGAGLGSIVGIFGFMGFKSLELVTGMTTAQWRYLNHSQWLNNRLHQYDKIRLVNEDQAKELYKEIEVPSGNSDKF